MQVSNDGRKGGLLVGETDKDGGIGIKAKTPPKEVILGGGEIIINENSAKKHCKELSDINVDGGGVSIPCNVEGNTSQKKSNGGEIIKGGLADGKSISDIAVKHNVPLRYALTQWKSGIEVEKEHTSNKAIAKEIAIDHLFEDIDYYKKLSTIEKLVKGGKIGIVLHEFKKGTLYTSYGKKVTDPSQAYAIAISEERRHRMENGGSTNEFNEGLSYLLKEAGNIPAIGNESGKKKKDGISKYVSEYGSYRYVKYVDSVPVSGLQIMSRDGVNAKIANVYTSPDQRGKGFAQELFKAALKDFKSIEHSDDLSGSGRRFKASTMVKYQGGGDLDEAKKIASDFLSSISPEQLTQIRKEFEQVKADSIEKEHGVINELNQQREKLLSEKQAKQEAKDYHAQFKIIEDIHDIDTKIRNQENILIAIKNGGDTSSFTDKKGAEHNGIPNLRNIKTDFIYFDEETILTDPLPAYIPLINEEMFAKKGYIFDAIRLDKDVYILSTNGYREHGKQTRTEENMDVQNPAPDFEQGYALVTLDQLALINDYYTKKAKATIEKKGQEVDKRQEEYYDKLPRERRERHFSQKGFYHTLPASVKKKISQTDWEASSVEDKEKFYKPFSRGVRKRITSKLESNQMWVSFHEMYERFINPLAVPINKDGTPAKTRGFGTYGNPETFQYWYAFRYMMDWKIKDIAVQRQFESDIRKTAIETSFGESNTDNVLKEQYGILVKRQNGEKIQPNEIEQIRRAWEGVNRSFGTLTGIAKDSNLKISHTGKTLVFASKAVGMYIPKMKTIAVSAKLGDNQFENIMAHEVAHWIDNSLGSTSGHRYASDDFESKAGMIGDIVRRGMNKKSDSDYTNSTKECFARALEQYYAIETHGQEATVIANYTELDIMRPYFAEDAYVPKEVYDNKLKPLIVQFLEEIKEFLKYDVPPIKEETPAIQTEPVSEQKKEPIVMDEETYLGINGASRQGFGDAALHKNRGRNSDKTWSKMVNAQAEKDRKLAERREELRKEYAEKVAKGEIRPLTRIEKLMQTAEGHPDLESTQAARRILKNKGINWEQKQEPMETNCNIGETKVSQSNEVNGKVIVTKDTVRKAFNSALKTKEYLDGISSEKQSIYRITNVGSAKLSFGIPKWHIDNEGNKLWFEFKKEAECPYTFSTTEQIEQKTEQMTEKESPVLKEKSVEEYKKDLNEVISEQLSEYEKSGKNKQWLSLMSATLSTYFENIVSKHPEELGSFLEFQKNLPNKVKVMAEWTANREWNEQFSKNLTTNIWKLIPDEFKEHKMPKRVIYKSDHNDKGLHNITSEFVGYDYLRPMMMGVHFNKDGIVATDAHKLLFLYSPADREEATYCLTKDCLTAAGEKLEGNYPNYKRVVPDNTKFVSIHTESLINYLRTVIAVKYVNTTVRWVLMVFDSESEFGFTADVLLPAVEAMYKLGYDQIDIAYSNPNRGITICKKGELKNVHKFATDFALVMPIMLGGTAEFFNGAMYFNAESECVATKGIADKSCLNPVEIEREKTAKVLEKANEVLAQAKQETAKAESKRASEKIADNLMRIESKVSNILKIESDSHLYDNIDLQKSYKKELDEKIVGKFTFPLSMGVFDAIEDNNYHTLNSYLSMSGAYGEEKQKHEFEFLDGLEEKSKTNYLNPSLYRPDMPAMETTSKPTKEVLSTRLKIVKKMYDKNPSATLKTRIKIIEKMLKNPEKYCGGMISNGGITPNNYEGKSPEWLWNHWTQEQRVHFCLDHHIDVENEKLSWDDFSKNETNVKKLTDHLNMGEFNVGGGVWTKEQREAVGKLDEDFEVAVKEKGINRNSKDASDFWRTGGFQKRMFDIFNK